MGNASLPDGRGINSPAEGLSLGKYRGPLWPQPLRWVAQAHTAQAHPRVFKNFNIVKL